jgi:hypothetical protein
MRSTNGSAGSGTFSLQFNATKISCNASQTGSISATPATSFNYFSVGALVDPSDYEVMLTLGSIVGGSNISTAGGSATLGVWISLSSSPLYSFSCSERRGGGRTITVEIRHKIQTSFTASTVLSLIQDSDAVAPTFSGLTGTTTLTRTTTNSYLGLYIDSESSANAGRIRTYKTATIDTNNGFTFSTDSIPESEYEFQFSSISITPGGSLSFGGTGAGSWVDISTGRANSPSSSSGGFFLSLNSNPAGTGVMRLTIRHKLDPFKTQFVDKTFQAS